MLFLLTPPHGGRLYADREYLPQKNFYSRPRVRGDEAALEREVDLPYFYSRPRVRGDEAALEREVDLALFLLTPQNKGRTHRRGTPQAETGVRQP